jgi:glycosyltransferase involved in cell wall biosynthesis
MIYVGSLKYSPVYKSHCCTFGKACEDEGYSVKYLFSGEYAWMLPHDIKEKTVFVGNSRSISSMMFDTLNIHNINSLRAIFKDSVSHVYLHNYHFLNHLIANQCRKYDCKFIYHCHEPYVENKSAHGGIQQYWLYLSEYMNTRLVKKSSVAVVSSNEGSRLFDAAYTWFEGKKLQVPLLYEDLAQNKDLNQKRIYVTFVGPPLPAKGPETFLKIINFAAEHNIDWTFLMISSSKVFDKRFIGKKNLLIVDKPQISDEEFGDLMAKSLVVLTPYKRETQSSVILVAYMYGTPVVSNSVGGLPEFVKSEQTGYLLDIDSPVEEWIKKISLVIQLNSEFTENCRRYFLDNHAGANWRKYLSTLLEKETV